MHMHAPATLLTHACMFAAAAAAAVVCRLLWRLLQHAGSPLALLAAQQQASQQQASQQQAVQAHAHQLTDAEQELLALAVLRAQQLQPQLAGCLRASLWLQLLRHPLPLVRWAAVQGAALQLRLSDAVQQQLLEQRLSQEQLVAAEMR